MEDFYTILSLPRNVKPADVKKRFRELARERHPDRFIGEEKAKAEIEFQRITEAFNVLMDPVRRRQHDLELDRPAREDRQHDPEQLVRVYLNRGIRAYKQGNFAEAADNFSRATQAQPKNYQAWHHLALACNKQERWLPKAQEAITKACELRPNHIPYLKLAGKIFARSGMASRAKQYYNEAISLGGSDPAIRQALKALEGGSEGASGADGEKGKGGLFRKMW